MNQGARLATTIAETAQREANMARVRAIHSLGRMALAVLTSTKITTFYRGRHKALILLMHVAPLLTGMLQFNQARM
jgi:hypothetical protein